MYVDATTGGPHGKEGALAFLSATKGTDSKKQS
jgi:hypothetical protein